MSVRVGLNGLGRMGRALYRASLEHDLGIEIVAFNDIGDLETMAGLLARDLVYGRLRHDIKLADDAIIVDGSPVRFCREKDPAELPWKELSIDVAVEATGRFRTRESASAHLVAGASRVVVSAPVQGRRRHHRSWRQREVLRSQPAQGGLQRLLHHQLPGADDQGPGRQLRRRTGIHHHDPCLHG